MEFSIYTIKKRTNIVFNSFTRIYICITSQKCPFVAQVMYASEHPSENASLDS